MIQVSHLSKVFKTLQKDVVALRDVSFHLNQGTTLAICGDSGAGKSTLLNLLGGLDRPTSGRVLIDGCEITGLAEVEEASFRNKKLGFVFQFHHLLQDFTILENVMMPLLIGREKRKTARDLSLAMLKKVGIEDKAERFPPELSGGEQQRAAIARALVNCPKMIFADEPTGNLDDHNSQVVFDLLCQLNRDLGATLIVVTHNHLYAHKMDHRLILASGEVKLFE